MYFRYSFQYSMVFWMRNKFVPNLKMQQCFRNQWCFCVGSLQRQTKMLSGLVERNWWTIVNPARLWPRVVLPRRFYGYTLSHNTRSLIRGGVMKEWPSFPILPNLVTPTAFIWSGLETLAPSYLYTFLRVFHRPPTPFLSPSSQTTPVIHFCNCALAHS